MYTDGIALVALVSSFEQVENLLTNNVQTMMNYLETWCPKLSIGKSVSSVFHFQDHDAKGKLAIFAQGELIKFEASPTYLGVCRDRSFTFKPHLMKLRKKVNSRNPLLRNGGASPHVLRTSVLVLASAPAEYCSVAWRRSTHTSKVDVALKRSIQIVMLNSHVGYSCVGAVAFNLLGVAHLLRGVHFLSTSCIYKRLKLQQTHSPNWGMRVHQS